MAVILGNRFRKWADPATGREGVSYWCEGCEMMHGMCTSEGGWKWNGDPINCVFSPSQDTRWMDRKDPANPVQHICHTFIGCNGAEPGQVIFLGDSTHKLAGQVRPVPELPDWLRN